MKLLKLVLIALVTVGIYSFTIVEKTKDQPIDKIEKVVQYDGCVTIYFRSGLTDSQKSNGRKWVLSEMARTYPGIIVGDLFEQSRNYERYHYSIINPNTKPNSSNDSDESDGGPGSLTNHGYATFGIGDCNSTVLSNL
ncbi:hypothetical protein [Tenacibaculum sp. 190524A05c]|uniref:hypothetical protein n=1 Tax=Tenacibaculum platacis TaxID=3137852 RepID=UPI0031FB12CC